MKEKKDTPKLSAVKSVMVKLSKGKFPMGRRPMGLGRKNLAYSMALAGVMLLFLVGYFICMLPSLYVDHVMEENLKSVRRQHASYMEHGTYEEAVVRNSSACFTLELPEESDRILVSGKAFTAEVFVRDQRLSELLGRCRKLFSKVPGGGKEEMSLTPKAWERELREVWEELEGTFKGYGVENALPFEINLLYRKDLEDAFSHESVKIHRYSDHMLVLEASVEEMGNRYTNYIAMEQAGERFIFTYLPVVTPDMDEIRPVVLGSLPMLGAVILLVVLLFSLVYRRGIVTPVVELVQHAEQMKRENAGTLQRLSAKWPGRQDEVRQLADTLDDFYEQIVESLQKLEEKSRKLAEENERKEVFLRSFSHQLKTPVAAALLLVDGMIGQVGKYRDTKEYLPRVKSELLSMRKIVEDILYLSRFPEGGKLWRIDAAKLLRQKLEGHRAAMDEKELCVELSGEEELMLWADEVMMGRILDNLLSNAVKYTREGGRIEIALICREGDWEIRVENFGARIPEELLPHIYEPFVSGDTEDGDALRGMRSHGLGLYLASLDAKKMGVELEVSNKDDSVLTRIFRKREQDSSDLHQKFT